jgi:hypothetical protein
VASLGASARAGAGVNAGACVNDACPPPTYRVTGSDGGDPVGDWARVARTVAQWVETGGFLLLDYGQCFVLLTSTITSSVRYGCSAHPPPPLQLPSPLHRSPLGNF